MLNKPKRTKYPTYHNLKKSETFNLKTKFLKANCGLIAIENSILTASQLATAILTIKRKLKNDFKFLIRTFPHIPVTKRPPELPLGKGKSNISYWATSIKAGSLIFELETNNLMTTKTALIAASYKLPFKTHIVFKLAP